MVIFYKNSFLASVFSIIGSVLIIGGIVVAIEEGEILAGIAMAVIGVALILTGRSISRNKTFKKWWKQQITEKGLEPHIAASVDIAVQIYNKVPGERALKKIRQLNPAAAEYIQQHQKK